MKFAISRRPDPTIDVTPMIDVVFQLVLFFMVSTTFITTPGIEVELPKSSATAVISDTEDLTVLISDDGSVFVNDVPVTIERLTERFAAAAKGDSSTLVIIKADKEVAHGRVVAIMDRAKDVGLSRLAIATVSSQQQTNLEPTEEK